MLGFESEVAAALEMMRESPLCTTLVEQCHGSGAQLMKRHQQLEHEALMARLTVHNCRTWFHQSFYEKQVLKLIGMSDDLLKKMRTAHRMTERNAYIQLMIEHCKSARPAGGPSEYAVRKAVIKGHMKPYSQLSTAAHVALRSRVSVKVKNKLDNLADCREHVEDELGLLRRRQKEAQGLGVKNLMDSCRFGTDDLLRFQELYDGYDLVNVTHRMRPPPAPVPAHLEAMLTEHMDRQVVDKPEHPFWLATVVDMRELFHGCGLYSAANSCDASTVFKIMLCIGQPRRVIFIECQKQPVMVGAFEQLPPGQMPLVPSYVAYSYLPLKLWDQFSVPLLPDIHDLMVFTDMEFKNDDVHGIGFHVPFAQFTQFAPRPSTRARNAPFQEGKGYRY